MKSASTMRRSSFPFWLFTPSSSPALPPASSFVSPKRVESSLELDEHLALHLFLREGEMLAIPHDGIGEMDDILAESLIAIEGMGQCDPLRGMVVESGVLGLLEVADLQQPLGIEVDFLSLDSMASE